ncbi:MAG TPA: LPS export ABC transporter permease LptG [Acidobacteriaceae bacterium]|nr:LPS export ABC transporter permease LptG [Acidobacteriaceae bacterium]
MRILTRYILKEVVSHAFIGGAIFTFVLFIRYLPNLLELVVRNSASLGTVLKIVFLLMPNMFTVTIPMAVLVGILLGLSRLAADSEVTAMRASGIGVWTFVRVVGMIAVAAWLVSLANTMYFAPKATAAMLREEDSLANAQASYEVQPRVFYEDFKNVVLYVQDVRAGQGAANWRQIFLADVSDPTQPKVTTADRATVVNGPAQTITMRLRDGEEHSTVAGEPGDYTISTFAATDLPLQTGAQEDVHLGKSDTPILAMDNRELLARTHGNDNARLYQIEFQKRLAYPAACLVLMLVGVPLGIASRRGGKSAGFVLTIVLVFAYYFVSSTGTALARQNKIPAFVGVWEANALFALCGVLLLRQMSTGGAALAALSSIGTWMRLRADRSTASAGALRLPSRPRQSRGRFPLILDEYVLREFLVTFALVLVTFVMLMLVFTFFELLSDIIKNRTPLVTVGAYLINLTPSMIYLITPLSVLIGVLVVFGVMNRNSELTAMKATGISLYRITVPVLVIAAMLSVALFAFDELYLPQANRRQEALRNVIKGKPAATVEHPGRNWMFGDHRPGQPSVIFYYQYFDPDINTFGNITVFEFDPGTFDMTKRIFATTAEWQPNLNAWVFEDGWERTFKGPEVAGYRTFAVSTFPEVTEAPSYFTRDVRPSSEMSFGELARYIHSLRQSGFNTVPLRVQLNHKLAYPLITLVMGVLAIPFALSMGRRGSLSGIAVAIGVAIAYYVVSGFFENMGNVSWLPAFLAAWSPDLLFGLAGAWLLLRTQT